MTEITSANTGYKTRTRIGPPENARYVDIPVGDTKQLFDLYSQQPSANLHITPEEFLIQISLRMYTEWCMFDARANWERHRDYRGEAFVDFIRDETHYELRRQGFQWHHQRNLFLDLTHERYNTTRDRVLEGFVRHAKDFFEKNEEGWKQFQSKENGEKYIKRNKITEQNRWICYHPDDPRNLIASLEAWIPR